MSVADLFDVGLVLIFGAAVSWLCQRYQLPAAVANVVLGVILGGAVLGWVSHSTIVHTLGEVGVVLLLGVAGLELGIDRLKEAGWAGISVAFLGIAISLGAGYFLGRAFGSVESEAIYIGLVLAATSIGIGTQVLQQYGLIEHRTGEIVIAAAVIDDVIALYLLAATHGVLSNNDGIAAIVVHAFGAVFLFGFIYWSIKSLTSWLITHAWLEKAWVLFSWILLVIFASASVTDVLGLSAVVGGFFAGVGAGDGLKNVVRHRSLQLIEPLLWVTMPFYFVMIGVQAEWSALATPESRWFLFLMVVIGAGSKALGGVLGAIKWMGTKECWLIGFGMVARGEVALVIATLGLEQGHVSHDVFVSLVLGTIFLTVLGPILMTPFAKGVAANVRNVRAY